MKKLFLFLSVFLFIFGSAYNYAESAEKNTNTKKSDKEATTDKFFKNIVDGIEKTTEDSVNKISKDIKDIKKKNSK